MGVCLSLAKAQGCLSAGLAVLVSLVSSGQGWRERDAVLGQRRGDEI